MIFRHCEGWVFRRFEHTDDISVRKYVSTSTNPPVVLNMVVPPELAEDYSSVTAAHDLMVRDVEKALTILNNHKKWDRRTSSHYF